MRVELEDGTLLMHVPDDGSFQMPGYEVVGQRYDRPDQSGAWIMRVVEVPEFQPLESLSKEEIISIHQATLLALRAAHEEIERIRAELPGVPSISKGESSSPQPRAD